MITPNEINRSFRTADYERWQKMAFVVGIEVSRSKNPNHECEICKHLKGVYPKDFLFIGWHEKCICVAVPVMLEGDEFIDYLIDKKVPEGKMITEIPKSVKQYIDKNIEEFENLDWYKLNKKYL